MAEAHIDNFAVNAPKHIDNRYLKNGTTPYASKEEAHSIIPDAYKYETLPVCILVDGVPTDHWYRDGIELSDLIVKDGGSAFDPADLADIQTEVGTKATLPDGLTKIGSVTVSVDTATVSGFEGIYQGAHINLPAASITLDPKDASATRVAYDRYDTIYFTPANNTYGKVTGDAVENPVKPIPVIPTDTFRIADVRRNADGTNVVVYAPLNGYVTLNGSQDIFGEKRFNDGISSSKQILDVRKPINTFWPVGFWVNYENVFHNNSVLFVDDTTAEYFDKVVKVPQGMSRLQPHAIYGPYVDKLPAGEWVYEFQLKVSDNTISTDIIQFDIAVGGFTWGGHFLNIKPSDFPNTTQYKTFRVPFTATKGTTYEFRIHILPDVNPLDFYFNYGIVKPAAENTQVSVDDIVGLPNLSDASSGQVLKFNGTQVVWGEDLQGPTGADGDMFKSTYDANLNGVVDDAEKLNNHAGSYYLSLTNATDLLSSDKLSEGTSNHLFNTAYRDKVDGIEAGATKNSTDAFLLDLGHASGFLSTDKLQNGINSRVYSLLEAQKLGQIQDQATKNSPDDFLLDLGNAKGSLPATKITYDALHREVSDAEKTAWFNKQPAGDYATNTALNNGLNSKQPVLVYSGAGQNIKTVGGVPLGGTGDIPVGSGGIGDMSKAVYDTNNNGIVDRAAVADAAPWTGLTGVPATFTPSAHSHATDTWFTNALAAKQATLQNGVNFATINGTSLLQATNLSIPVVNIVNNLNTSVGGSALDAVQGNTLQINKADKSGIYDISITDATKGFVLKCAANGNSYRLSVVLDGEGNPIIALVLV